jgi:DNA-binding transcriptional MerR regulator
MTLPDSTSLGLGPEVDTVNYNSRQLAQTLGISETAIAELQAKGLLLLQPTIKDGRSYFFSQQAHRFRVAVRWARKDGIDIEEALACVEARWLARTRALKE